VEIAQGPIDFVVTWVSQDDAAWSEARSRALRVQADERGQPPDEGPMRWRDWGTLRYWFRSVEAYAPWVRTIHLLADSVPNWFATDHPKLRVVSSAALTDDARPRYNSLAIEAALDRVPDLAEQFVYFNDDFFLTRPLEPTFFFRRGLPYGYPFPMTLAHGGVHAHAVLNAVAVLNEHFSRRQYVRAVARRSLRPQSGLDVLRFPLLMTSHRIPPATDLHLPVPLRRSVLLEAFAADPVLLEQTRNSMFRSRDNVHEVYLATLWHLATGQYFAVRRRRAGRYLTLGVHSMDAVAKALTSGRVAQVCLNDELDDIDPALQSQLIEIFDRVLPRPSSYERD